MCLCSYRKFLDERGRLGVVEDFELPFKVRRVFWITNVPPLAERGHHTHRECRQFIVCIAGTFEVWLDDICHRMSTKNDYALLVEPGQHIRLCDFSPDAVCLVLASDYYNRDEMIDDGGVYYDDL